MNHSATLQLIGEVYSYTYIHQSLARYSFIHLSAGSLCSNCNLTRPLLHFPGNRSTSTPKPTVRQSTDNVTTTNNVTTTTPVGVKPVTPVGVKPVTPGPLQDPDCQQTDTPVGKENDTRRLSRQPHDTPTQGGPDSNHRLSTAGPSSETLGLRNHRVKVGHYSIITVIFTFSLHFIWHT